MIGTGMIGRKFAQALLPLAAYALSLGFAYNSYKKYIRVTSEGRFPQELELAVKSMLFWAFGTFVLLYVLWRLLKPRVSPSRTAAVSADYLAVCTVVLGGVGALGGAGPLAVVVISMIYFTAMCLLVKLGNLSGRGLSHVLSRLQTTFQKGASSSPKKGALLAGLFAAVLIASAFLLRAQCLYFQNTLHNNGNWTSTKMVVGKGLMGAISFVTTRTALHRNRLNLDAWHGFQEVLFKEEIDLEEMEFDFLLEEEAYFSFLFKGGLSGYSGIRISRSERFDSIFFTAAPDGEFLAKRRIDIPSLGGGWSHFRFIRRKGECDVHVNGDRVIQGEACAPGKQIIGFRGGLNPCLIDDVTIKIKGSEEVIRDDFSNRKGSLRLLGIAFAILCGMYGLLLALLYRIHGRLRAPPVFYALALSVPLFLLGGMFFATDYLYISARHPLRVDFHGYETTIEDERQVLEKIQRQYPRENRTGICRIMFIGTSQIWGAGAFGEEGTAVRLIEEMLRARLGPDMPLECINTGISGARSRRLLALYRDQWIEWEPRLTVINLSCNDKDSGIFAESLRAFASLNRSRGIETLFVLEPISVEKPSGIIRGNHDVMRKVAASEGIPFVDLHGILAQRYDSGFLWWDFVHLTPFGQRLFAEELLPALQSRLVP